MYIGNALILVHSTYGKTSPKISSGNKTLIYKCTNWMNGTGGENGTKTITKTQTHTCTNVPYLFCVTLHSVNKMKLNGEGVPVFR